MNPSSLPSSQQLQHQQPQGQGGPTGGPADESAFKRPERSRRRERSPSPTPDASKDSGANASSAARPLLISQRGKRKKEAASAADAGQWIQCDRCKKWVSTLDDNISDLSLYDDNNPNHLEYFCPGCREEEAQVEKRSSARLGSRTGNRPQYRESQPESEAEIGRMLDETAAELIHRYQQGRTYWRKQELSTAQFSKELAAQCAELEAQWMESVALFKRRLLGREDDLESARMAFEDFFHAQLQHLKQSIASKLAAAGVVSALK